MVSYLTDSDNPWRAAVIIDAASGDRVLPGSDVPLPWQGRIEGLVVLFADNSALSVSRFLNLLATSTPVALLDPGMKPEVTAALLRAYRPDAVLLPPDSTIVEVLAEHSGNLVAEGAWVSAAPQPNAHPELAVLLATSGSTGSPKTVRLSRRNVLANARSIAHSLGLTENDRAITTLPFHYSFGMSVITSHAVAGSPVIVTGHSVIESAFWEVAEAHQATVLAGVPQTYEMLRRLRIESRLPSTVRSMLQAGGRLRPELVSHFHGLMAERGGRFHVMYGQTEAAPRMACLPSEALPGKIGSVGLPIAGGEFEIRGPDGSPAASGEAGEVVYRGPNVMLGYAESRDDLALGDLTGGELETGDIGYVDADGFLFITGRMKRIAKVAGVRISLDDVESIAARLGHLAAVPDGDDGIALFCTDAELARPTEVRSLAAELGIHPKSLRIVHLSDLPTLPSGKVDYRRLAAMAEESR